MSKMNMDINRPKAREIWTFFDGEKRRPVLILNDGLNVVDVDVLIAKITSQEVRNEYDIIIEYWEEAKLAAPSIVRTTKLSYVHYLQCKRKIGEMNIEDFKKVVEAIQKYLSIPLLTVDSKI